MAGYLTINGERIAANHFAWDRCHKIYLIGSTTDRRSMIDYGYENDIFPISKLPWAWDTSCFLRFVSWADLERPSPVPQARDDDPVIEWHDTGARIADPEVLFTVTVAWETETRRDVQRAVVRIVNPDGTTCTARHFNYGPDGMTTRLEDEIAEWVGEQAEEFMDTYFSAAWEEANQHHNIGR